MTFGRNESAEAQPKGRSNPRQRLVGMVVELQTFGADAENQKKEGRRFYKMDENSIHVLHEDLTEEFQALANTHHGNRETFG